MVGWLVGWCHINHCWLFNTNLFLYLNSSISNNSLRIWAIDRILTGATTPGQSGFWSDSNNGVHPFPISSISRDSPSDCFVSNPGHLFYLSAEMQSVHFAAPFDWVRFVWFVWHINTCKLFNAKSNYIYISGVTIPGQSWPGSDGNEGELRIPQTLAFQESHYHIF